MPRRSFATLVLSVGILLWVYFTYSKSPWDPVRGLPLLAIGLVVIAYLWVRGKTLASAKSSNLPSGKIKSKPGWKKLPCLFVIPVIVILAVSLRSLVFDFLMLVGIIIIVGAYLNVVVLLEKAGVMLRNDDASHEVEPSG